jgi:histidine triad (HIT) family protein
MTSVFSKIIAGDLPGTFLWEDELCVVFMSINPVEKGHALLVPKLEIDHWLDAPEDLQTHLMKVAKIIGKAQQKAFNPNRVGLMIAGFEVPHLHIHLIPAYTMESLNFTEVPQMASIEELNEAANQINHCLEPRIGTDND